jgi:hypothetical protein
MGEDDRHVGKGQEELVDRSEVSQALSGVIMPDGLIGMEEERNSLLGKWLQDRGETLDIFRGDLCMVEGQLPDSPHSPGEAPFQLSFRLAGEADGKRGESD